MSAERYLTQSEAAALCGCDASTIKRHRARGHFPGARQRDDINRTWEVPVADLVAAGLCSVEPRNELVVGPVADRSPGDVLRELERANARIAAVEAALADRREEVEYLRRTVDALVRGRVA
jgi:hypothetical protein